MAYHNFHLLFAYNYFGKNIEEIESSSKSADERERSKNGKENEMEKEGRRKIRKKRKGVM